MNLNCASCVMSLVVSPVQTWQIAFDYISVL